MSVLASACVLAFAAMAGGSAWAAGGNGGTGTTGAAAGVGGTTAQGGDAAAASGIGSGGGGGGVTSTGAGANGGIGASGGLGTAAGGIGGTLTTTRTFTAGSGNSTVNTATTGQSGGDGTDSRTAGNTRVDGGAGGGGGGAAGVVSATTGTLTIGSNVTGGNGGNGGAAGARKATLYGRGGGGGGGQGGTGLISASGGNVTVNSTATVKGGGGGAGGTATLGNGGSGGDGGTGIQITGARTLTNSGTIQGGTGGAGGAASQGGTSGQAGAGGVAIKASGGVTIINSKTITGGGTADAIQFSGTGNTLELQSGSAITGNVVAASGGTDRLILGGLGNSTFNVANIGPAAQYRNFASFAKTGASTWTLSGTTAAVTAWSVTAGALSIAADGSLGATSGALTLDGGTLNTTATFASSRNVTLGAAGGTFDTNGTTTLTEGGTVSGSGRLTKQGTGTLVLTGSETYNGGTTISAGTLQIGSGGTSGSITGDVTDNGVLAFNRSDAKTFAGIISGSGSVQQTGTGRTTLTATNLYSGGTSVAAGTLSVSSDANLGAITGGVTLNGGTLNTSADLTSARTVAIGSAGGTIDTDTATTLTLNGVVSGGSNGQLTKQGNGELVLTGNNTYSGGTTVNAGVLSVSSDANLGTTGGVTLNGGILDTTGTFTSARTVALGASGGTIDTNNATTLTLNGVVSGSAGQLVKQGTGTLVLGGANTYVGGTMVKAGVLSVSSDANLGNTAGGVTLDGGTLNTTADVASARAVTLGASGGTVDTNNATTLTLSGNVSGTHLTKQGAGTLVLTGTDTYNGGTTISAGTLQVGAGGTTGSIVGDVSNSGALVFNRSDAITFADVVSGSGSLTKQGANTLTLTGNNDYTGTTTIEGGTLQVGNGGAAGAMAGNVTDNGALVFNRSNDSLFTGSITGNGSVTKTGTGTLTLTGDSNYGGGTTISGGTLQVGNGGATGSITGNVTDNGTLVFNRGDNTGFDGVIQGAGSVTKAGAGTLTLTGVIATAGATTIQSGTLQVGNGGIYGGIAGNVVNDGALVINRSDDLTYDGVVSGSGSATKLGAGTLTLTGDNNYTGDSTISAGTLQLGNGGTTGSITGNVTNNGALVFNRSDNISFDGVIQGTGTVTQQGSGTLVLTATNTYLGATTISAGTLQLGNGGNGGSIASSLIVNNGTLAFNRADDAIYSGSISGTGSVTKNGTGTTTLSGVNTYLGSTTVAGGTLQMNGALLNSAVDVTNGGTLTGSGLIANAVSIGDGATLRGTSGQTLTTGALTLASGSTINAVLGAPSSQALFQVNGALTLDGQVNVTDLGGFGAGVYRLVNYTGALTDHGLAIGTAPSGSELSVQTAVAQQVNLVNTAGQTLSFWDGANPANYNNGSVDGGGGTWTANGSNWTTSDGSMNAARPGAPGFVVFQNQAGTVTIDNSQGAMSVTGMQFATDGYVVNGDALTLSGAQAIIRVGDGSQVPVTAVINAELTGSAHLEKTDHGTLVLAGNNTYTGGTLISDGTLQLGNGGATGSILGDVTNNGTLAFNRSDDVTFAGTITGSGAVKQIGSGTTTLTATNDYTGGTVISAGTLQLGNGGTTGSITGDVTNNGTLAFNRSDAVAFAGAIAGSGAVKQIGSGTTTLTADNNYTGGTVISAGTLQLGNGGTTGSIVGNVVNNGTLAVNRSDAVTLGGAITGSGAVKQIGSGTTTLTGTSDYTGGTVISAGTLQLGNGGTSGSITGDVTNNGALAFNRSDAVTFAGGISGTGAVKQVGSGTTTLTGTNTYGGGTTISAGKLVGSAGSFGSGAIVDNAALEIGQTSNAAMANAISGNGSITKTGAGALNYTGNGSAFTGSTLVSAGTLAVNGSLGGTLTMASGTTLKGNGTVGNTVVQSGATVAPGNSIGLLNVAGNLTLAQGSTYQVEASSDGRSDQIHATGTIALQGGTVTVLADGNWKPTTSYSILNAAGGVTGTFGSVTSNFAFLDPSLSYDANGATLNLKRNDVSFSSVATTENERASGTAVQAAAAGTLYDAVVQLDAPTAARAFRQLTGEVHASVKSATIEDSRFVRDASLDRTRLAQGGVAAPADLNGKNGVWARTFGSWGDMRSDGNASTVDRSTSGILIGGDTQVGDDWRVGVLGGYSRANVDVHALNSSASSDSYHLGVYGGRQWGALGLRAGASYTDSSIDTSRIVAFTGFADRPTASYKSQTAQAFGELGWRIDAGTGAIEPFAGLAYVNLHTDDFAERGGTASLHGGGGSTDTTFSTLGVRGSNNVDIGSMKATVHGMVGWRHALGDVSSTSSLALAAQPAAFTVAGVPLARNVAVVEGGLDLTLKPNLTLGISYIGQFGNSVEDHGVKADLVWKF